MFVVKNIALKQKPQRPFSYLRKPAIWLCLLVVGFGQSHWIAAAEESIEAPVAVEASVSETPVEPSAAQEPVSEETTTPETEESVENSDSTETPAQEVASEHTQEQVSTEENNADASLFTGVQDPSGGVQDIENEIPSLAALENTKPEDFLPHIGSLSADSMRHPANCIGGGGSTLPVGITVPVTGGGVVSPVPALPVPGSIVRKILVSAL